MSGWIDGWVSECNTSEIDCFKQKLYLLIGANLHQDSAQKSTFQ